jgi:hypothetical protein
MTTDSHVSIPSDADRERYVLERVRMHLQSGLLGRLFGSSTNAPTNIAGVVVCLLVVPAVALAFFSGRVTVIDYLQSAGPFVTLVLGYLFGRRTSGGA